VTLASVLFSAAIVWCSSLVFADRLLKRQAKQDERDAQDPEVRARTFAERRKIIEAQREAYLKAWQHPNSTDESQTTNWNGRVACDRILAALLKEENDG